MGRNKGSQGALLLTFAIVYLVWGSTYLGIRYAIATLPPFLMAGTRFLVAGAILLAWNQWRGTERPSRTHWRTAYILGAMMLLCGNGGVTWAEQRINSGLAALLVASEPLWLVLLAWAKPGGAAPSRTDIAGLAIGVVGVGVLVSPGASMSGSIDLLGATAVLFAAAAWAAGSLLSTTAPSPKSPVLSNGMTMLAGGSLMFFVGLIRGEATQTHWDAMSGSSLGALAYLSIFGSLIAFSAYTYLLAHTTPAKASTYAFVNPVVAVLLGWALAGEQVGARSIGAMVAIVAAVILLTVGKEARHTTDTRKRDSETLEEAA